MKLFSFDPEEHRATWESQGWVHVPGAAHPDFLDELRRFVAGHRREADVLRGAGIKGAKGQYLYEPPEGIDFLGQVAEMVGAVCGIDPDRMTLSERHIKAYEPDADPDPPAHKDRRASLVSAGVSIEVPAGTRLVLYPETDVAVNPFMDTGLRDSLDIDELPENRLRYVRGVEIEDAPGDLVVFPGSAVWHRRLRSAGTVNLYLKLNDFGADPLGEDPRSQVRSAGTEGAAAGAARVRDDRVPVLSSRLEWFGVHEGHGGFRQEMVKVWDRGAFPVDQEDLAMMRAIDGRTSWAQLVAGDPRRESALVRLARRGAVDLLEDPS